MLLLVFIIDGLSGQSLEKSKVIAFTPKLNTQVNGIGLGVIMMSFKYDGDSTTTKINGFNFELLGFGIFGPLVSGNPLIPYDLTINQISPVLDSLILETKKLKAYKVNGLNISIGGLAGNDIQMNGLNISGISTLTARSKGVSIALIMNMNKVMHGVSFGIFNQSLEHKGLQIGLFNRSEKTKGIQIGLWNKNEKRALPFINWRFK